MAEGFVWPAGSELWGTASSFPPTKYPEALTYGRRVRLASAVASGSRPRRPVALVGHSLEFSEQEES